MHTNHLIHEKSPYLLQHAHNPVDWYPWGDEAFAKARAEDRPVFLSVGYSTCHWCHVMERESFENEEIAEALNRNFVPIKVDREERPDLDRIYMLFVQATSGGGGWPMSVWLTPEGKPFFGGTYFPPEGRYGRPGFRQVLLHLARAWSEDRARILASSESVLEELRRIATLGGGGRQAPDEGVLESGFLGFRRAYDARHGGFGPAPKFPRPSVLNFLLRYARRARHPEAAEMALTTLREMARGGLHDQVGGGFHRYSVDERWLVPHFEKMLYDQAQLAIAYVEAYQYSGDAEFARTARSTLEYVLGDLRHPEGGFYSAEDADSALDAAHPEVQGEGAFYLWRKAEIEAVLGEPAAAWFCHRYGVEEGGNAGAGEDPHGEFAGKNILYQARSIAETASHYGADADAVRQALPTACRKLGEARQRRARPHLDDKVLTAWNGLMISAFARAGAALGEPRYVEAAARAAQFVFARLYSGGTGMLARRYRDGEAAVPGFLDDYAFLAQALIDLYEAGSDPAHLERALALTVKMIELFEDREAGAFFSTAAEQADPVLRSKEDFDGAGAQMPDGVRHAGLLLRLKEDFDGAEPSGNSIAVLNLLRLAGYTGRAEFRGLAERALRAFAPRLLDAGAALPQMLVGLMFALDPPRQVVLAGERGSAGMRAMFQTLHSVFVPERIVIALDSPAARERFEGWIPELEGMRPVGGAATAYVCESYACRLPVTTVEDFRKLLQ